MSTTARNTTKLFRGNQGRAALDAARQLLGAPPQRVIPAEFIYAPDNHAPDDPVDLHKWAHETNFAPRAAYIRRWDQQADGVAVFDTRELQGIRDHIESASVGWARRCEWESNLAEYISTVGIKSSRLDLTQLASAMYDCHQGGPVVRTGEGCAHIAWRSKCEKVRVCPHASREETMRLAEHYVPGIRELIASTPKSRAYYAVFEPRNYAQGSLAHGKAETMVQVKEWIKKQKNVIGALVVQEDPLARDGSWNIHCNVILITQGDFSYEDARELAGCRVHFSQIKNTKGSGLVKAILEVVKYSAKPCATNDRDKRDDGKRAPFMNEWPPETFCEWWDAQQRFRRTRSYGALYAIDGKRWDAANDDQRMHWLREAVTYDREIHSGLSDHAWRDEPVKPFRDAIRKAMLRGERVDLSRGRGIGTVELDAFTGEFIVTLQPGNNSPENPAEKQVCQPFAPGTGAYYHPPP